MSRTIEIPVRFYSGETGKPASCQVIPVPPVGECNLTAQLPFLLTDGVRFRHHASIDKYYKNTQVYIDTAQYPGLIDATLEATVKIDSGAATDSFQWSYRLEDELGNIYTTISTPIMASPGTTATYRLTPVSFTPTGAHSYGIRVMHRLAGGNTTVELTSAVILLNITDSSKWKIEIPMFIGANFNTTVGTSGTEAQSNIDSYQVEWTTNLFGLADNYSTITGSVPADGRQFGWQLFKKDDSHWPSDVTWELEVWGMIDNQVAGATFYIALMDNDTNVVVADSEVHITATTEPTRYVVSFANNAANFTSGHTFRACVKASVNTVSSYKGDFHLYDCKLYAIHNGISTSDGGQAEVYFSFAGNIMAQQIATYSYFTGSRLKIDLSKFTEDATSWFFDQGGFIPTASGGNADLLDMGTTDTGIASPIVAATITHAGDDKFHLLRENFIPVDGDRYIIRETSSFCASLGRVLALCEC